MYSHNDGCHFDPKVDTSTDIEPYPVLLRTLSQDLKRKFLINVELEPLFRNVMLHLMGVFNWHQEVFCECFETL